MTDKEALQQVAEDEIDLAALAATLWARKGTLLAATLAGGAIAGAIAFAMPNVYTARASLMPLESSGSGGGRMAAMMSAMGDLPISLPGGGSTPGEKFVAILESRTVAEQVITRNNLLPVLFADRWDAATRAWKPSGWLEAKAEPPTMQDAVASLKDNVRVSKGKKVDLIEIQADALSPDTAASLANAYLVELNHFLQGTTLTSAKRNLKFLEQQVAEVTRELEGFENQRKVFQERHKIVALDEQAKASVEAYAQFQAQLVAKQMELKLLEGSAGTADVQVVGLKQEIAELSGRVQALESGKGNGFFSLKELPKLGLQLAHIERGLLTKGKVLEMLTQQMELARIEEARETLAFQVIDRAIAPEKKSKPKRSLITLFGLLIGMGVGVVSVLFLTKTNLTTAAN